MKQSFNFCVTCSIVLLASLLYSCGEEKEKCAVQPDVSGIKIEMKFQQLQDSLLRIPSKKKLVSFLTRYPIVRDEVFRRAEYPDDSTFINELYHKFNNPHFDTLNAETRRVFGDVEGLKAEFQQAFTNLKHYYPDITPPRIQTIVSGLDTDLYVSDSLIIVGLDFFLGRGAKYRPRVYDYLLRKYDPDDIVPSCMLIYGISPRFNQSELSDKTVLADMVAYGKSFYFAKRMLPCVPDSVLIWYTPEEIKGSRSNEDLIWKRFVDSQILYSTNHKVKQDYLGERPNTIQVGEKCPGRIGQWVGWQIVNKYADHHPDVSLPDLMKEGQAQRLFKESAYRPSH
ncbi:gliding motility lipoprotein GldB [Chryseolinea sp. T2]|uniref:gliding motility lipoprotein GldB n=1 Tax=Chryseolinea sp. T2 TaxID=3129255 RepID=UPI003077698F